MHKRIAPASGFTIVEQLIVIAVVALLALLTIFVFGDWRERTANAEAKTALSHVSAAVKDYANFNSTYPANLSLTGYKESDGITITYTATSTTYCAQATSVVLPDEVTWRITNDNQTPTIGTC